MGWPSVWVVVSRSIIYRGVPRVTATRQSVRAQIDRHRHVHHYYYGRLRTYTHAEDGNEAQSFVTDSITHTDTVHSTVLYCTVHWD